MHLYKITKAYNALVTLVLRMSKQVVCSCQIIPPEDLEDTHLCLDEKHYNNLNQEYQWWSSWSTILCSIWIQFKIDTPTLPPTTYKHKHMLDTHIHPPTHSHTHTHTHTHTQTCTNIHTLTCTL